MRVVSWCITVHTLFLFYFRSQQTRFNFETSFVILIRDISLVKLPKKLPRHSWSLRSWMSFCTSLLALSWHVQQIISSLYSISRSVWLEIVDNSIRSGLSDTCNMCNKHTWHPLTSHVVSELTIKVNKPLVARRFPKKALHLITRLQPPRSSLQVGYRIQKMRRLPKKNQESLGYIKKIKNKPSEENHLRCTTKRINIGAKVRITHSIERKDRHQYL